MRFVKFAYRVANVNSDWSGSSRLIYCEVSSNVPLLSLNPFFTSSHDARNENYSFYMNDLKESSLKNEDV